MINHKKRLFIAINLPEEIKTEMAKLLEKLDQSDKAVKWSSKSGLHLTLHFLGYIDEEKEAKIKIFMQSLAGKFGEIKFQLGHIGAFPNLNNPRVIFISCEQINGKSIFKLHNLLKEKLEKLGLETDKRYWQPHLTLGRVREFTHYRIDKNLKIEKSEFLVSSFELMESELTPAGAVYEILESYKL